MKRKILAAIALVVVAGFLSTQLPALGAPPQAQTPPAAAAPPRPPQTIDLATAKKMAAAAEAEAVSLNGHVAICVMDSNFDIVYLERMDTAIPRAVTSAIGHARAALILGVSDIDAYNAMKAGKPIQVMLTAPPQGNLELTIEPAGIPIMKDGKMIGAIGAGGIASLNDEKVAQAGIDSLK
jgi:glc operon protein GlcG